MIKTKQNSKGNQSKTMENFKRKSIASFFIMLFVVSIFSPMVTVAATPPPDNFTLTTHTIGNGTVTIDSNLKEFVNGTVVNLTAVPDYRWQFVNWSGDIIETVNSTTITMDANKTVTATFEFIILPTSITITPDAATINVNSTQQFTATVFPEGANQNVIWSVDNGTIDESGFFTANVIGNATITATSSVNSSAVGIATVTVNEALAPTLLNIAPEMPSIEVGATQQFTATVLPEGTNQSVTWYSSDSTIGTIDAISGLFTANEPGNVNVIATSNVITSITKNTTVTVRPTPLSINITPITPTLSVNRTQQFTANILPESANQSVTWSVSDSTIGTIDANGFFTALATGNITIIATSNVNASITEYIIATVGESLPKPRMAIFLHSAQFGIKAAFELVPESSRPVNLSFYNTLDASNYINESLDLTDYEFIIVRSAGHGGRDAQVNALLPILESARNAGAGILSLDVGHNITTIDVTLHGDIEDYFNNMVWFGTAPQKINALNLMNYAYVNFMNGVTEIQSPRTRPAPGIYHPDAVEFGFMFRTTEEYIAWSKNRTNNPFNESNVTIGFIACAHFTSGYIMDEFIAQMEARGANVIMGIPISGMMRGMRNPVTNLFYHEGNSTVDAIITFQSFLKSVPDSMRIQQFKDLNVPVFGAVSLGGMFGSKTEADWRESPSGIDLNHVGWFLSLPEMIGVAAPTVVAVAGTDRFGSSVDLPIPSQITRMVDRAINHAELRHIPNQDKRIALIHFEYTASGLNNPVSIERLLANLSEQGYTTDVLTELELIDKMRSHGRNIGMWAQPTLERMVQNHGDEVVLIPVSTYREWFNTMIPEHRRNEVNLFWGEPEDGSMIVIHNGEPHFVFPRINAGNIMIMPQPSRGGGNMTDMALHHDLTTPPHHQYIAFHLWLQVEDIDAIIHFGTHGSQEWLPGKERGLDDFSCWPSLMSGEIPIIYPYIVDNVGEAIQAKRRGDAIIISHMTPQLVAAGVHGELRVLHDLIHRYRTTADETVRAVELRMVIEKAINMSVDLEMEMPGFTNMTWDSNLTELIHMHVHDVEKQAIPVGLHILGEIPNQTLLNESVMKIIGPSFINEIISLGGITGEHDCYVEDEAKQKAIDMLYAAFLNETTLEEIQNRTLGNSSTTLANYLEEGAGHLRNFLLVEMELISILNALSGGFIIPGPGGDPLRNPESLPTGRNLFSFDPRSAPTRAAWEVGRNTMRVFIADFHERNGRYPDKLAFVLFAGETMRQNGVAEAQILYAMGIEPVWDRRGRVRVDRSISRGLRLIPDAELGRPRIDVAITMTCLYRDTFPCRVTLMDAAVRLAIEHAGDGAIPNHVRSNYQNLYAELKEMGYDSEIASSLASARVFGPPTGGYGLGLSGAVLSGGTLHERDTLAGFFLNRMGNIYSKDLWSEPNRFIFERILSGTDAAIFSRSSNLYGVLTTDHPFEWLGGLGMAVESIDGTAPELMITDLRNPHAEGEIVTLSRFLRMELRARQYNPRYIRGLMEHGWAGAQELGNTISNLYGWQIVAPDIVTDDIWNNIYNIFVQDSLNLGVDEFFNENNALAKQEIMRRMLSAYERGLWYANAPIVQDLVERVINSVAEHGLSCCSFCCANLRMDNFIRDQMATGNLNIDRNTARRFDAQISSVLGRSSDLESFAPIPELRADNAGVEPPKADAQAEDAQAEPIELPGVDVGADAPVEPALMEPAPVEPALAEPTPDANVVEGVVMEPVVQTQPERGLNLPVAEIVIGIVLIGFIGAAYMFFKKKS